MELSPEWRQCVRDFTPETGGILIDEYDLTFTCPACGPPFRVSIKLGLGLQDEKTHRWQANILPDGASWPDRLTLIPSIDNTRSGGHGRKHPTCLFHGSIVKGEIVLEGVFE